MTWLSLSKGRPEGAGKLIAAITPGIVDPVSSLGGIQHASPCIFDSPAQLFCKTPFGIAMGIVRCSGGRPFGGSEEPSAFLSNGSDGA
jgi:hypothetical protein